MIGQLLRPVRAGQKHLASNESAFRDVPATVALSSPSFEPDGTIPRRYAGRGVGDNISPALNWSGVPESAKQLALIIDLIIEDADAPLPRPIVHVLALLPPELQGLDEGALSRGDTVTLGRNSLRSDDYAGPRPVPGHGPHTYVFQLFAIDRTLTLRPSFTRRDLLAAMSGAVLARGRLDGIYER
jgi:Raf kinase inhibitor-like YbhB/YbcL family protein